MKSINLLLFWILTVSLFATLSCTKDDETEETTESDSGYALWVITDPTDLSGMIITNEEMFSGEVDPTSASHTLLGAARAAGISYNGAIYNTSNTSGDLGMQKFTYGSNSLTDAGFIANGESRFFIFEVVSETKGYYTDSDRSRKGIQTFNPSTMQRTGEIDLSEEINNFLTDSVSYTKIGSFMVENEGYLYTQIFFYKSDGTHAFDSTFLAVIDITTDELVNIDIHPDYIWLGFERKNPNFIGKAENGDLYLASVCGNATDQAHSRCLRIKSGETSFDDTWKLDYNDIIGEEGSYSLGGPAVLNNKLYIRLKASGMASDYSNITDNDLFAYEVDIDTKTAKKIDDIPASIASSGYSVSGPVVIDDLVYFAVSNEDYEGYYTYDPSGETVEEAFSITGGIPSQLIQIN